MKDVYKEVFAEVLEVLNNSNQNIIEKIPKKFITFLNENKDNNYNVKIDFSDVNWDNSVKPETQAILALVYRDFIASPIEREKLLAEEKEEQIKHENELRKKYDLDNLFKNKAPKVETIKNDTAVVKYKESVFQKILNKIKNIFHI